MSGHKSGKSRGYEYDVDAWVQFHLLRLAAFHPDTTKADLAILAEIIQRYKGEFGNGWASHDHLGSMAGVHKATVIRAKQNLERLGFITVISPGVRGRATVYAPNFDLVPQKGSIPANLSPQTLGSTDATLNTELGSVDATTTPELGSTDATPTYLQSPAYKADRLVGSNVSIPPAAEGLAATAPGAGFEKAWAAYGKLGNKQASRAAWATIAPDAAKAAQIIERASSWAASAKPGQRRMVFQKWLSAEKWDEADRRPVAANDNGKPGSLEVDCIFVEVDHLRVVYYDQPGFVRLVGASADAAYDAVEAVGAKDTCHNMTIAERGAFVAPPSHDDIYELEPAA